MRLSGGLDWMGDSGSVVPAHGTRGRSLTGPAAEPEDPGALSPRKLQGSSAQVKTWRLPGHLSLMGF